MTSRRRRLDVGDRRTRLAARAVLLGSIAVAARYFTQGFAVPAPRWPAQHCTHPIELTSSALPYSRAARPSNVVVASGSGAYPFWVFEWSRCLGVEPVTCAIAMFISGVLCSAAGIGGGGIYVSLLMALGGLSTRDAVPLSKGVVFMGALPTLVLNLRRTLTGKGGGKKSALINYTICRIVVPASLVGTLFGVLINQTANDNVILIMLATILVFMATTSVRTTWRQYKAETAALKADDAAKVTETSAETVPSGSGLKQRDVIGGFLMLALVVACGTIRFHLNSFKFLAGQPWLTQILSSAMLFIPVVTCLAITAYSCYLCVGEECWRPSEVVKYAAMSVFTGCFAGLVGIGGGLIFSPFFLIMGVDPSVAVATSSTCVLFTSSSTTLQYLLSGRIIMSLCVLYGGANLFASYCGTSLVHLIQDRFAGRRSFISGIVSFSVVLSTLLVLQKLVGV